MKCYIRGLASTVAVVGMLAIGGCSPDNEDVATKGVSVDGKTDPGPANPNAVKTPDRPLPKTQKDFFDASPKPDAQKPTATPTQKKN